MSPAAAPDAASTGVFASRGVHRPSNGDALSPVEFTTMLVAARPRSPQREADETGESQ
jgi:tRNA (Thr-GGU) A37 N-methylase